MECELELASVRCDEAALAALILQVEPQQRSQVLRAPCRGPVDPTGIQLRGVELEPVETNDLLLHLAIALA